MVWGNYIDEVVWGLDKPTVAVSDSLENQLNRPVIIVSCHIKALLMFSLALVVGWRQGR